MTSGIDDGGDLTDRRTFTRTTALVGLGLGGMFEELSASPTDPVGADHLALASSLVDRFEQGDAVLGGDALCDVGISLHERLGDWDRRLTSGRSIGAALRGQLGELECWIGWLALDAERRDVSRRYLQDAIVRSRLHDDPRLEVRAMVYLSLLIRDARPHESLQCAEAAMRISAAWATPRLTALLHLRAAHALGVIGDISGFGRHMAMARTHLDRGTNDDDPTYLHFVTPMELTGVEGLALLCLGRPDKAIRAFRTITEHPDPAYRRNHGYYSVHLAEAYRRKGAIAEAARVGLAAVPAVAALHSPRTHRSFAAVRAALDCGATRSLAVREFIEAYDAAMPR